MKKTKLQKLAAIKKNLENRLTKINTESYRIQCIQQEYNPFFKKVELALNNDWTFHINFKSSSNERQKQYWLNMLFDARDGDEDSLILLRAEFKYNESFKQKTGAFKNV